jgi:pSer/pThr/pTyr-binding forkhead associated (FHA) protein
MAHLKIPTEVRAAGRVLEVLGEQRAPLDRPLLIGRDATCDLVIPHQTMSRQYARLDVQNGGWWVEDLGSASGTWVNGRRATGRVRLSDGDRLQLGVYVFTFSAEDGDR